MVPLYLFTGEQLMTIMELIDSMNGCGLVVTDEKLLEQSLKDNGWYPNGDMNVLVIVEGGVIQEVQTESGITVTVKDFDVDGEDHPSYCSDGDDEWYESVYGGWNEDEDE